MITVISTIVDRSYDGVLYLVSGDLEEFVNLTY